MIRKIQIALLLIVIFVGLFLFFRKKTVEPNGSLFINGKPFYLDGSDFTSNGKFPKDTLYIKKVNLGETLRFKLADSLVSSEENVVWNLGKGTEDVVADEFTHLFDTIGNKTLKIEVGNTTYYAYLDVFKKSGPQKKGKDTEPVKNQPKPCISTSSPDIRVSDLNGGEMYVNDRIRVTGMNIKECYIDYAWDYNDDGRIDITGEQFQHSFDSPGTKVIRLTMLDKNTKQEEYLQTTVQVRALPTAPPPPPSPPPPAPEKTKSGRAGYSAGARCEEAMRSYQSSDFSLTITPKQEIELKYIKVLPRTSMRVNASIKAVDGEITSVRNRQVLAGQASEINFQSLAYVLEKGKTYTISISAVSGTLELEDLSKCNAANSGNNELTISQKGGVFFDIAYKY